MERESRYTVEDINSLLLRKEEVSEFKEIVMEYGDLLAKAVFYRLKDGKYNRQNMIDAILNLVNFGSKIEREYGWMAIQKIPLSHLVQSVKSIKQKARKKIRGNYTKERRAAFAIAVKFAKSKRREILRAFFLNPKKFRKTFVKFFLPREFCCDVPITNENYRLAITASRLSTEKMLEHLGIPFTKLADYGIELHQLMQYVKSKEDAEELSTICTPDNFFQHARWFKNILGDDRFQILAFENAKKIKNPLDFLDKKQHLQDTGALTEKMIQMFEQRTTELVDAVLSEKNLKNIVLMIDASSSMSSAIEVSKQLFSVFSRASISNVIAFRDKAFSVDRSEDAIENLKPRGFTSIGDAFVELYKKSCNTDVILCKSCNSSDVIPSKSCNSIDAILCITDLQENTRPMLSEIVPFLNKMNNPPLVFIHVSDSQKSQRIKNPEMDYPYAVIPIKEFHRKLVLDIFREIARITAKTVTREQKMITEIVRSRNILSEEIMSVELPRRPSETFIENYLRDLLCLCQTEEKE